MHRSVARDRASDVVRRSLLACALLMSLELTASPSAAVMLSVAHRAGRNVAWPENTIPDIQWSLSVGADWIEVDVWKSADGVLILHHDKNMCRTTNIGSLPGYDCSTPANNPLGRFPEIRDFDLAFLKTLDVGSWLAPEFTGISMPTLEEALLEIRGTGTPLVLDIKTSGQAATIAELLDKHALASSEVISWNRLGVQIATEWKTALPSARLLYGYSSPISVTEQDIASRAAAGDFGVVVTSPDLTQDFVDLVHGYGLFLMTYPSSTGGLDRDLLVEMGVDAMVEGNPEWLRGYLDGLLCWDNLDNDGDGWVDFASDPECNTRADRSEVPDCLDGLDNDDDGTIDFPADRDCIVDSDLSETPDCSDQVDNDRDGLIDWPNDPACATPNTQSEVETIPVIGALTLGLLAAGLLGHAKRSLK